jgi:glycosyltransferase involved in cell wall biosynthesis
VAAPTVSVAMATYNGAQFLEPQLASIAAQTRLPDELVVCDDQSSDESVEIVERFASRAPFEVRVVRNPKRLGFGGNFLQAARLSRGDLIAWSDQDDVWMPEKLAVCAHEFERDGEVVLVVHASWFGGWIRHGRPVVRAATADWLGPFTPRRTRRRTVYTPTSLPLRTIFPGRSSLVSRRVLDAADALQTRLPGIIDEFWGHHDIWIPFVAGAIGKVVMLPDALVQYRQHEEQVTGPEAPPRGVARGAVDGAKATADRVGRSIEDEVNRLASNSFFFASVLTQLAAQLDETTGIRRGPAEFRASLEARVAAGGDHVGEAARNAARRSEMYRRRGEVVLRRLELRSQPLSTAAAARLIANVVRGDYGPRHRGGLGLRSLAMDLLPANYRDTRTAERASTTTTTNVSAASRPRPHAPNERQEAG